MKLKFLNRCHPLSNAADTRSPEYINRSPTYISILLIADGAYEPVTLSIDNEFNSHEVLHK